MHILVLGGGAREHALIKALKRSKKVTKLSCAPGNPGIALEATCNLSDPTDPRRVTELVARIKPDLVIVGPEAPLAAGVINALGKVHVPAFGPPQESARLETSKVFSKEVMQKHSLPTARAIVCSTKDEMLAARNQFTPPYVIKADGLAAGKGVRICKTEAELTKCADDFFVQKVLGEATQKVLVEEFIEGEEISLMILLSGDDYTILPMSRDHKKLLDEDKGPNTGGMGAFAPVKKWSKSLNVFEAAVIKPTIEALRKEGLLYRGVLYIGAMIDAKEKLHILEFNVRFGDPEAQVILPLLKGDWAEVFMDLALGKMPKLVWTRDFAVSVVMAASGYPDAPEKGAKIIIDRENLKPTDKQYILHGATSSYNGLYANGGRVLNAVAIDKTLAGARKKAYQVVEKVQFEGMQYRKDIGESGVSSGRR